MFLTLVAFVSIFTSNSAGAAEPSCEKAVLEVLDVPMRWGFPRRELDLLLETKPELHAHLASLVRLERFITDPDNLPFLDFLGSYLGVGFSLEAFPFDGLEDPVVHREKQLATIVHFAWHNGILEETLGDEEIRVLGAAFGPLAPQNVVDYSRMIRDPRMPDKLTALVNARRDKLPRFLDLLLQSESVQFGALNTFVEAGRLSNAMIVPMVPKLKARLFGVPLEESAIEGFALDMILNIAKRDVSAFIANAGGPGVLPRKRAVQMLAQAEVGYVDTAFSSVLRMFCNYVETQSLTARRGILAYPLGVMGAFEKFLEFDAIVDRNVTPEFRRLLPELLFDAPALTAFRVQKTIRAHLDRTLRETRELFKEFRTVERATTGPDRDQRKRDYAERLKSNLDAREGNPGAATRPAAPAETFFEAPAKPEYDLWTDLLDESRSVPEVVAAIREKLVADRAIELTLENSGHRYRVEFSKRVLDQMTDTAAGHVDDPRAWLEAMRAGPARAKGQQGWKKLHTALFGVYDWEIKVLHSTFRMLGYKRSNKVWRFETIQDTH